MARQRLLLLVKSYFALGGTGAEPGVTSPRGPRRFSGMRARARRRRRLLPERRAPVPAARPAPRAPRRLCSLPGPAARHGWRGARAGNETRPVHCPVPDIGIRDAIVWQAVWWDHKGRAQRIPAARERGSRGYVPMVEIPPAWLPVGRPGTVEAP